MPDHYQKYEQEAKKVCAELNQYLMSEFGYKTHPAYVGPCNTIYAKRKTFDICLRHKSTTQGVGPNTNILVIARIFFDKPLIGRGTSLLKFIVRISDKYGYERIAIESASNERIIRFAKKYGFENNELETYWVVSIENLKKLLGRADDCMVR